MDDGVFLSTSNWSVIGDSAVSVAKNTAVSQNQSQLPLKHMVLYVDGCCHRNIYQVPVLFQFCMVVWKVLWDSPRTCCNDGFIDHKEMTKLQFLIQTEDKLFIGSYV